MSEQIKKHIQQAIAGFNQGDVRGNALHLLETLGYESERRLEIENTPRAFLDQFDPEGALPQEKALFADWRSVDLLFQLTDDEIRQSNQMILLDSAGKVVDDTIIESYLFLAIALNEAQYTRSQLAQITREVNKLFPMPAMLIFHHGQTLTLSIIDRRLHKRDQSKDVLEKVTLIKDIRIADPHRAHVEILFDLSLAELYRVHEFSHFVGLHQAWQKTLDSSELNKRFFKEIANWYFWAVQEVTFPEDAGPAETRNATSVIRLITRLIFAWFLKEKGLVPNDLFHKKQLDKLLLWEDEQESSYYKAILQNLFFATLNQEMNTVAKPDNRRFRGKSKGGADSHYLIHNVYRYEDYFQNPKQALELFANVPFLNGGLFECLDKKTDEGVLRVDGFSDRPDNALRVPDELFFGAERQVDLNETYGTSGRRYQVRGLVETLKRYKFTITENTPIEEEIALDPELLGKVFENLLAAYNPETGTTARKQTGSFYTPREIVNYMVDESLLAYMESKKPGFSAEQDAGAENEKNPGFSERLRHLFAYNEEPHQFDAAETEALIAAIDQVNILDPACGSGAFPMGILHKLVFILGKLDPHNEHWREVQRQKALDDTEEAYRLGDRRERDEQLLQINAIFERNASDYGRKLYLVENCIYGVDIQPIAVQIAKLRFFISLVVDQRIDDGDPNRGILPLPNLETKFVAANTLLGIGKPQQMALRNPAINQKEAELADVRSKHFRARTPATKEKYRREDQRLRAEIGELLKKEGMLRNEDVQLLAAWDPYDQNASAEFFDMDWMYGLETGFDVVIGNPPYVRQEKIKDLKPALQAQYSCYTGVADLYVYFIEGGYNLLQEGGVLCYICSNKYFRAGYGKKLRGFLSKKATIHELIDFGDAPVFTAFAYPSIILFQKTQPNGNSIKAFTWEPGPPVSKFETIFKDNLFLMPQTSLGNSGWKLKSIDVLNLLEKLQNQGTPLGQLVNGEFYRGITTGFNAAFVIDAQTKEKLIEKDNKSAKVIKPWLRGRDLKRWTVNFEDLFVIHVPWDFPIEDYPAIHAHLRKYKEIMEERPEVKEGRYPWYAMSRYASQYVGSFDLPKIVYPDIAKAPEFAYDDKGMYGGNTLYIIPTNDFYLLAILNSSVIEFFYTHFSSSVRGGYLRFIATYMEHLPISVPTEIQKTQLDFIVRQILSNKVNVKGREREIDELVYALYKLTPAEIALVEGRDAPPEAGSAVGSMRISAADTAKADPTNEGGTAEADPMNRSEEEGATPPLLFTGQAPQGSFNQRLGRVQALAKQATPAAIQELTAALGDDNGSIVYLASASLRQIGGPQVRGVLQAFIAQSDNVAAKAEARKVLGMLA